MASARLLAALTLALLLPAAAPSAESGDTPARDLCLGKTSRSAEAIVKETLRSLETGQTSPEARRRAACRKAIAAGGETARLQLALGRLERDTGNNKAARRHLAAAADADLPEAQIALGRLLLASEGADAAERVRALADQADAAGSAAGRILRIHADLRAADTMQARLDIQRRLKNLAQEGVPHAHDLLARVHAAPEGRYPDLRNPYRALHHRWRAPDTGASAIARRIRDLTDAGPDASILGKDFFSPNGTPEAAYLKALQGLCTGARGVFETYFYPDAESWQLFRALQRQVDDVTRTHPEPAPGATPWVGCVQRIYDSLPEWPGEASKTPGWLRAVRVAQGRWRLLERHHALATMTPVPGVELVRLDAHDTRIRAVADAR